MGTISVATGFLPFFSAVLCGAKLFILRNLEDWGG